MYVGQAMRINGSKPRMPKQVTTYSLQASLEMTCVPAIQELLDLGEAWMSFFTPGPKMVGV